MMLTHGEYSLRDKINKLFINLPLVRARNYPMKIHSIDVYVYIYIYNQRNPLFFSKLVSA